MSLQNFTKKICKEMEKTLGDGYQIQTENIPKNNEVTAPAVAIRRLGEDISACIYADDFYKGYQAGRIKVADVVEEILYIYRENSGGCIFDLSVFENYCKAKVRGRLINTAKNRELLEKIPHREFLDLSLTYLLEVAGPEKSAGHIQISKGHLKHWNIDEEKLYQDAIQNITRTEDVILQNMGTVLEQMLKPADKANIRECPAYILTNRNYRNGAVQMLNKPMLKSASCILKGDFILLPSSIHERATRFAA